MKLQGRDLRFAAAGDEVKYFIAGTGAVQVAPVRGPNDLPPVQPVHLSGDDPRLAGVGDTMENPSLIRFDIYCIGIPRETSVDLPAVPKEGDQIRVMQRRSETGNHTSLSENYDASLFVERVVWRSDNTALYAHKKLVQPNPALRCRIWTDKDD